MYYKLKNDLKIKNVSKIKKNVLKNRKKGNVSG